MSVYSYDKLSADDQVFCEVEGCDEHIELSLYALCAHHRAELREKVESILSPRKTKPPKPSPSKFTQYTHTRPESKNEHSRRYWRYSLSVPEFNRIKAEQGNRCAMCGFSGDDVKLHIDHDHKCCPQSGRSCGSCVRGLLCFPCNTRLGHYEDEVLKSSAEKYLSDPPARRAISRQ